MAARSIRWRRAFGMACGVLLLGGVLALSGTTATSDAPTPAPPVIWSTQPPSELSDLWIAGAGWAPNVAPLSPADAVDIAQQVAATTGAAATMSMSMSVTRTVQADGQNTPVLVVTLRGGPFLPWHSLPIGEVRQMQATRLQVVIHASSGKVLRVSGLRW